jgi:hypothetical protein
MAFGHGGAGDGRRRQPRGAERLARLRFERGGLFRESIRVEQRGAAMANHLTPEELSKEIGIDREEVIRICLEEHVPIYHGKIDKTLFQAQLEAIRAVPPKH